MAFLSQYGTRKNRGNNVNSKSFPVAIFLGDSARKKEISPSVDPGVTFFRNIIKAG